jgi:hypothetical protein
MDRSDETESAASRPEVLAPLAWKAPRLARMGTVAALTRKVDNIGRNDGGIGTKKRT